MYLHVCGRYPGAVILAPWKHPSHTGMKAANAPLHCRFHAPGLGNRSSRAAVTLALTKVNCRRATLPQVCVGKLLLPYHLCCQQKSHRLPHNVALSQGTEPRDPFRSPQGWTLGCLSIEGQLLWQQQLETSCYNNLWVCIFSVEALSAPHKTKITFSRQYKIGTNMKTANTLFTGDNKHRCCKVQVVTNLWPAVVVQSNNFACGKLGSSSRKCHAMFKNWKSCLIWEEVRVSTIWGLSTDPSWWLVALRTADRSLLPSQTHLWSSSGSCQAPSP